MIHDIDELLDHMRCLKERIEGLKADYEKVVSDLKDCRNELCLKCGSYREAHKGACDGCRWKEGV